MFEPTRVSYATELIPAVVANGMCIGIPKRAYEDGNSFSGTRPPGADMSASSVHGASARDNGFQDGVLKLN